MATPLPANELSFLRQSLKYLSQYKNALFVLHLDSSSLQEPFLYWASEPLHCSFDVAAAPRLPPVNAAQPLPVLPETLLTELSLHSALRVQKILTALAKHKVASAQLNTIKASYGVHHGTDHGVLGVFDKTNTTVIENLLAQNILPVFGQVGFGPLGKTYLLSCDYLAKDLSVSLQAAKLVYVSQNGDLKEADYHLPPDFPVLEQTLTPLTGSCQTTPSAQSAAERQFTGTGPASGTGSLRTGRGPRSFSDCLIPGVLLKEFFSDIGCGTMLHANPFDHLRPLAKKDLPAVLQIMAPYVKRGNPVPRTAKAIQTQMADYVVFEVDGTLHACGALHPYPGQTAEIAAVAVDEQYQKSGLGKRIINYLIQQAKTDGLASVFVLTTLATDFFVQLGFREIPLASLPAAKLEKVDRRRNSKALLLTLGGKGR